MQGKSFPSHKGQHFQMHRFLYGIRMIFLTNMKNSVVMLCLQTCKLAVMTAVIGSILEVNTSEV